MRRQWILSGFILVVILAITVIAILIAKGYRYDQATGSIEGTGIISASVSPNGASIYLNGQLQTSSNGSITGLVPKTYDLKVVKDGYSSWEKVVTVVAEKVTLVEVTIYPTTPSLVPLTFSRVKNPLLSPDGQTIVYAVTDPNKAGLWALNISTSPFNFNRSPQEIAVDSPNFSFSTSNFSWSPDSKNILITGLFGTTATNPGNRITYLLDPTQLNTNPVDVTASINQIQNSWQADQTIKNNSLLALLPKSVRLKVNLKTVLWSPDESKILWVSGKQIIVYNLKLKTTSNIPLPKYYMWFPDSKHILTVDSSGISIVDSDGVNKAQVYSGNFEGDYVYPWPDGSKLVILTSFNNNQDNLYTIDLR